MTADEVITQHNITTEGVATWARLEPNSEKCAVVVYRTTSNPIVVRGFERFEDACTVAWEINDYVRGVRKLKGLS